MSDSNTNPPLLTRKGLSWALVVKIMAWCAPLLLAAILAYFRASFVPMEMFSAHVELVQQHIGASEVRIHSLEEFKTRSEVQDGLINESLKAISATQASQAATLNELAKGQERIFNRLDKLSDRTQGVP